MDNLDINQGKFEKYLFYGVLIFLFSIILAIIASAETCKEGGYYKRDFDTCPLIASISNNTQPITSCSNPTIFLYFPETNATAFNWSIAQEITGVGQYWVYTPNLTDTGNHRVYFNCTQGDQTLTASRVIEVVELLPRERFENLTTGQQRIIDDLNLTLGEVAERTLALINNQSSTNIYNELITAKNDLAAIRNSTDNIDVRVNTTYTDLGSNFTGIYTQLADLEINLTLALLNITGDVIPRLVTVQNVLNDIDANVNISLLRLSEIQVGITGNFTDTNALIDAVNSSLFGINISISNIEEDTTSILQNISTNEVIETQRFDGIDGNLTEIFNDTDYIYNELNCTSIPNTSEQVCGYLTNLTNFGVTIDANIENVRSILGIVRDQRDNEIKLEIQWVRHEAVFGLDERSNIQFFVNVKDGYGQTKALDASLVSIFQKEHDTLIMNITNGERLYQRGSIQGLYFYTIDPDIDQGEYRVRIRAETTNTTTYGWTLFSVVNKTALQQIEENTSFLHNLQAWMSDVVERWQGWIESILWGN